MKHCNYEGEGSGDIPPVASLEMISVDYIDNVTPRGRGPSEGGSNMSSSDLIVFGGHTPGMYNNDDHPLLDDLSGAIINPPAPGEVPPLISF